MDPVIVEAMRLDARRLAVARLVWRLHCSGATVAGDELAAARRVLLAAGELPPVRRGTAQNPDWPDGTRMSGGRIRLQL